MISVAKTVEFRKYIKFFKYQFTIMIGFQAWIFLSVLYLYSLVMILMEFAVYGQENAIYIFINALPFSIFAVLVCMNLIPKERESGILESLFTNQSFFKIISLKAALVLIIIVTSELVINMAYYFTAMKFNVFFMIINSLFPILLMISVTLYLSLFVKNPNATAMLSLLIMGVFFKWIFFAPYTNDPYIDPQKFFWKAVFNRSLLLILIIIFIMYIWRRLRNTEKVLL